MKFEIELDKMPTTQQQKGIKKVKWETSIL